MKEEVIFECNAGYESRSSIDKKTLERVFAAFIDHFNKEDPEEAKKGGSYCFSFVIRREDRI